MKKALKFLKTSILILILGIGIGISTPAKAEHPIRYQGRLKDALGNYGTGDFTIRFSIWDNSNTQGGDVAAGVINPAAPNYLGWSETHNVTIDTTDNGLFVVFLGENVAFPFSILNTEPNVYIQIDIKSLGAGDDTYEQIDASPSQLRNRRLLDAPPQAANTKKIDNRDVGYNPDEIPYLNGMGQLPDTTIPNGTPQNEFILDRDGNAAINDTISLKFGDVLAKSLSWNGLADQFELNDTLSITGDLLVSGKINDVTIGKRTFTEKLSPAYPNAVFHSDGSNNTGSMYEETEIDGPQNYQIIRWSTAQTTIQDYEIQVQYTLPTNFVEFEANNQIAITYKTDGLITESTIDIKIEKEGSFGTDQINGAGMGLSNNNWTQDVYTLEPTTTWTAGDTLIFHIKMFAVQNFDAAISDIDIRYIGE